MSVTASQGGALLSGTSAAAATPGTFTIYKQDGTTAIISGYINPIVSGINLTHNAASETIANHNGDIVCVTAHGEMLEATFELIPFGTSNANALKSATLPDMGCAMVTSGLDIIQVGSFTDGLNVVVGTGGSDAAYWLYLGGGSIRFTQDGHATMSLPCKRFPKVVTKVAIVD